MSTREMSFSRRRFLQTAGTIGMGSVLAATGTLAQASNESSVKQPGQSVVPTRPFGRTGVSVSVLGLGGMFDIPSNQLMLKQALKWGVSYWDTADCYGGGRSESGIGAYFDKYPDSRKEVFLVTKSDDRDSEGMTQLLNRSLDRLKTDWIDLYLLHAVSSPRELTPEVKAWAEKAKAAGKIKFFGISTHSNMEDCMFGSAKAGWVDGIMMSYNFRLMQTDRMKSAVDACSKAGIGLTAMKTQGGGQIPTSSETELEMAGRFVQQGFSDKQAKLMAVWESDQIASICSQMPNLTILMSNVAAALNKIKLGAADRDLLDLYARETASSYCAGCTGICEPCLAARMPIGDVMRYLMYYHSYGERDLARGLYAGLRGEVRGGLANADFSIAERKCPQGLPIGKLMQEAERLLA